MLLIHHVNSHIPNSRFPINPGSPLKQSSREQSFKLREECSYLIKSVKILKFWCIALNESPKFHVGSNLKYVRPCCIYCRMFHQAWFRLTRPSFWDVGFARSIVLAKMCKLILCRVIFCSIASEKYDNYWTHDRFVTCL